MTPVFTVFLEILLLLIFGNKLIHLPTRNLSLQLYYFKTKFVCSCHARIPQRHFLTQAVDGSAYKSCGRLCCQVQGQTQSQVLPIPSTAQYLPLTQRAFCLARCSLPLIASRRSLLVSFGRYFLRTLGIPV